MCTTKFSKHPKCKHWSTEILNPCEEGKNFGNCKSFEEGRARNPKSCPREMAKEGECPKCDKKDDYDGDQIRMVKNVEYGYRFGLGPSEGDFGIDLLRPSGGQPKARTESQVICCTVM